MRKIILAGAWFASLCFAGVSVAPKEPASSTGPDVVLPELEIPIVPVIDAAPLPTLAGIGVKPTHPIDEPLEGVVSRYTPILIDLLKHWPPTDIDLNKVDPNPVKLTGYRDPENEFYIGAVQVMDINTSIARVDAVMADVDHYRDIFPGYKEIKVLNRDGNKYVTYWERRIPFPFISNVKYQMSYLVDSSRPDRFVHRYQLKEANKLNAVDGMVVLEKRGENLTRFIEYDFFDAEFGILKTLAPQRILRESFEGLYLSDLAIKYRAENPDWNGEKIVETAEETLKKFPVAAAVEARGPFYKLQSPVRPLASPEPARK